MENIDNKQQNLAGKDMKAKKEWMKPELNILNMKNTELEEGFGDDGVTPSNPS